MFRAAVPALAIGLAGGVSACAHERVLAAGSFYTLSVVGGDGQSAPAGSVASVPLTVSVRNASGTPVKAAVVVFRVENGAADGAAVTDSLAVSDELGKATAELRLGAHAGSVSVLAYPQGAPSRSVTFHATAGAGPTISGVLPVTVSAGDTIAVAGSALGGASAVVDFGGVRVRATGGTDGVIRAVVPPCLAAGSTSLRVINGAAVSAAASVTIASRKRVLSLKLYEVVTVPAAELATCLTLSAEDGAQYVLIPQFASWAAGPSTTTMRVTATSTAAVADAPNAWLDAAPAGASDLAVRTAQQALDASLRAEESRLASLTRNSTAAAATPTTLSVGSLRSFHVATTVSGDVFADAVGRLRYLGDHLGIYVDTVASTSYSDADLQQLGAFFDTELYRTATQAFGPESDIDGNGRVLVFLTPRVNGMVAAADCGFKGFVTGYFTGRDLLPQMANSNGGEIFYALVPDAYGWYSCSHAPYDVKRMVASTFVHEMQHMISFFHHVVARGGEAEQAWLNEGLSHISEELVAKLFEARYPAPLGRATAEQMFPDSASPFIAQNLLDAYVYLNSSAAHSVTTFTGTGSIEERGAAWLFLRWLGDQKGEDVYRRLVQTSQTGIANVEARTGESFSALFGDFAAAIWMDSIPGVPRSAVNGRYRFSSRNLRSLMARQAQISGWPMAWPIMAVRLPIGGYAEGPLVQGTMVWLWLGPFSPGTPSVGLTMGRTDGGGLDAGLGARLGILRVK